MDEDDEEDDGESVEMIEEEGIGEEEKQELEEEEESKREEEEGEGTEDRYELIRLKVSWRRSPLNSLLNNPNSQISIISFCEKVENLLINKEEIWETGNPHFLMYSIRTISSLSLSDNELFSSSFLVFLFSDKVSDEVCSSFLGLFLEPELQPGVDDVGLVGEDKIVVRKSIRALFISEYFTALFLAKCFSQNSFEDPERITEKLFSFSTSTVFFVRELFCFSVWSLSSLVSDEVVVDMIEVMVGVVDGWGWEK